MDFIEYTNRRIVLADNRTLSVIVGYSFIGAGLILLLALVKTDRYLWFGLMLIAGGAAILYFSTEQTYITLDREAGKLEIQRRPIIGKVAIERFDLEQVTDVRTVTKEAAPKLSYRIEIEVAGAGWVPLTNTYLRDSYGFEKTEAKIRGFLEAEHSRTTPTS